MKKIGKIAALALLSASLFASEVQYGSGTISLKGGLFGLNSKVSENITSYSMVEQHKNLLGSNWYYKYNFTWFDSQKMTQSLNLFNSGLSTVGFPQISYKFEGMDINAVLGYDLRHKSENDHIGIGVLFGISTPWIESQNSSNSNMGSHLLDAMQTSKTKFLTYKIGPSITFRKNFGNYFAVYGSAAIGYEYAKIKNGYAQVNSSANGLFQEYDAGIMFIPLSKDYKVTSWLTLSPRLYATLGYRYTDWKLNDIAVNITGLNLYVPPTDFQATTSIGYFGLGYSF